MTILLVEQIKIHPTHSMTYAPCLFLECSRCWTTVRNGQTELAQSCEGLNFRPKKEDS